MTTNQLLTWGAIGFAAFAAFTIIKARRPSGGSATAGQDHVYATADAQSAWADQAAHDSTQHLSNILGADPFTLVPTYGFDAPSSLTTG